jgi:hypothetical protein
MQNQHTQANPNEILLQENKRLQLLIQSRDDDIEKFRNLLE